MEVAPSFRLPIYEGWLAKSFLANSSLAAAEPWR